MITEWRIFSLDEFFHQSCLPHLLLRHHSLKVLTRLTCVVSSLAPKPAPEGHCWEKWWPPGTHRKGHGESWWAQRAWCISRNTATCEWPSGERTLLTGVSSMGPSREERAPLPPNPDSGTGGQQEDKGPLQVSAGLTPRQGVHISKTGDVESYWRGQVNTRERCKHRGK